MYHLVRENVHKYAATVSRRDQLLGDGFHLVEDEPKRTFPRSSRRRARPRKGKRRSRSR